MEFSVKNILLVLSLIALSSCLGFMKPDKGELRFSEKEELQLLPLAANYQSLKQNFIDKSCLRCHHSRQDEIPSFATQRDVIENAEDLLFYAEEGCDLDTCMPPKNEDGTPTAPIPAPEVLETFRQWMEEN